MTEKEKADIIKYLLTSDEIVREFRERDRKNVITCYAPSMEEELLFVVSWEIWHNYVIVTVIKDPKEPPVRNVATAQFIATDNESVLFVAEFFINEWRPDVYALPMSPDTMPGMIEEMKQKLHADNCTAVREETGNS